MLKTQPICRPEQTWRSGGVKFTTQSTHGWGNRCGRVHFPSPCLPRSRTPKHNVTAACAVGIRVRNNNYIKIKHMFQNPCFDLYVAVQKQP